MRMVATSYVDSAFFNRPSGLAIPIREPTVTFDLNTLPDKPVLIAGPTASGKSSLALKIAQEKGGVIVNADAIQVYDHWRVLTARPSVEDESIAKHLLYGHIPYTQNYSVGHWLRDIEPILSSDERPIIVGGTGLYFTALTEGLAEIPPTPTEIRQEADALREQSGFEVMLADLAKETLDRIDQKNPMRVQRAWEVWRATGRHIHDWQDATPPPLLPLEMTTPIVVDSDKDWLNSRIEQRFDKMLSEGALAEAENMLPNWDPSLLSSKAIGAPELIAYLKGEISLEQAREDATIATRQFAKRQRTWFRSKMKDWIRVRAENL